MPHDTPLVSLKKDLTTILSTVTNNKGNRLSPASVKAYVNRYMNTVGKLRGYQPSADPRTVFDNVRLYKQVPTIARQYTSASTQYDAVKIMYTIAKYLDRPVAHEWLYKQSLELRDKRDERAQDQTVVTKKHENDYVPFDTLVAKTEQLVKAFAKRARELVQAKQTIKTAKDRKIHDHALIAWLNVVEPNIRSALADARIVTTKPTSRSQGEDQPNLVYVPPQGQCILVLNSDKVSVTKDSPRLDSWEWRSDTSDLMRLSIKAYPRTYLFKAATSNKPMGSQAYNTMIMAAFQTSDGKRPSQQTIRHATVDHFYSSMCSPPLHLQRDLARRMRHSVEVQNEIYRKVHADAWPSRVDLVKEEEGRSMLQA